MNPQSVPQGIREILERELDDSLWSLRDLVQRWEGRFANLRTRKRAHREVVSEEAPQRAMTIVHEVSAFLGIDMGTLKRGDEDDVELDYDEQGKCVGSHRRDWSRIVRDAERVIAEASQPPTARKRKAKTSDSLGTAPPDPQALH